MRQSMAATPMYLGISYLFVAMVQVLGQERATTCPGKCLCDADLKTVCCKRVLDSEFASILRKACDSLALSIENSNIRYLKNETFDSEVHLQEFTVVRSSLYGVEESTFEHLGDLVKLNLSSNKIEIVGKPSSFLDRRFNSAIAYLPNFITSKLLRIVDLSNNDIKCISAEELYGMKFVQHLDLSGNNIKEVGYSFRYLMGVKRLNLSFNRISIIDERSFELQMVLEELDLSRNYISELPHFNRLNCAHLHLLRVSFNEISAVAALNTKECSELRNLEINGNSISFIRVDDFKHNEKLENLNIADNEVSEIPDNAFSSNSELKILLASGNRIPFISSNTLAGLKVITTLDLDRNRISTIAEDAFFGNVWLQYLFLQNNEIHFLFAKTFVKLSLLKVVNLKNNRLSVPSPEWLLSASGEFYYDDAKGEVVEKIRGSFATFLVSGNSWNCDCKALRFYKWSVTQKYFNSSILPKIECASPAFHKTKRLLTMQIFELRCDATYLAASYFVYYLSYFAIFSFALLIAFFLRRGCMAKKQYHVM